MPVNVEDFQIRIGQRIRQIREDKDLSQEEIAGVELSRRTIQRIENGETNVTARALFYISNALQVHPKELFDIDFTFDPNRIQRKRYERNNH